MEWKDLEKMTVLKVREEALKYPQIAGVHAKQKGQLMDEIALALGLEKPRDDSRASSPPVSRRQALLRNSRRHI